MTRRRRRKWRGCVDGRAERAGLRRHGARPSPRLIGARRSGSSSSKATGARLARPRPHRPHRHLHHPPPRMRMMKHHHPLSLGLPPSLSHTIRHTENMGCWKHEVRVRLAFRPHRPLHHPLQTMISSIRLRRASVASVYSISSALAALEGVKALIAVARKLSLRSRLSLYLRRFIPSREAMFTRELICPIHSRKQGYGSSEYWVTHTGWILHLVNETYSC